MTVGRSIQNDIILLSREIPLHWLNIEKCSEGFQIASQNKENQCSDKGSYTVRIENYRQRYLLTAVFSFLYIFLVLFLGSNQTAPIQHNEEVYATVSKPGVEISEESASREPHLSDYATRMDGLIAISSYRLDALVEAVDTWNYLGCRANGDNKKSNPNICKEYQQKISKKIKDLAPQVVARIERLHQIQQYDAAYRLQAKLIAINEEIR